MTFGVGKKKCDEKERMVIAVFACSEVGQIGNVHSFHGHRFPCLGKLERVDVIEKLSPKHY